MVAEDQLEHITLLQDTMLDGEILVMKTDKWQSSPMIKNIHSSSVPFPSHYGTATRLSCLTIGWEKEVS